MKRNWQRYLFKTETEFRRGKFVIIVYLFGIKIIRKKYSISFGVPDIVYNVFNTKHKKKMLLSYITSAFKPNMNIYSHTNYTECRTWAQIFNELGYQVDVVNWDQKIDIDIAQYSVVCGFGFPYEKALFCNNIKKFFYAPGCNPDFSNIVSIKRVQDFYSKTGVLAPDSARVSPYDNKPQLYFSDMIVTLGNDFVANTYSEYKNVKKLDIFCYKTCDISIEDKDFERYRNNFLFFGSSGAIHKGLDIVLDFFMAHPELNLTVCGVSYYETAFREYYSDAINGKYKNITFHSFIDLTSETFQEIMRTHCAFVSPSASEGGAPAALTVMTNGGLLPIISRASGLDLEEYGVIMNDVSHQAFEQAVAQYLQMSTTQIKDICIKCQADISQKHTYDNYKTRLKQYVTQALNNE